MFSDVVCDALHDIEKWIRVDYCYSDIYPRDTVINMLKSMYLCIFISDARNEDGTYVEGKTLEDLEQLALEEATRMYEVNITKKLLKNEDADLDHVEFSMKTFGRIIDKDLCDIAQYSDPEKALESLTRLLDVYTLSRNQNQVIPDLNSLIDYLNKKIQKRDQKLGMI
jgi:hypothetical protein